MRVFTVAAEEPKKPDPETAQKWNEVAVLDQGTLVDSVAFAPDGKTFAVGGPGGEAANTVTVWETATRKRVWKGGVFPAGRTAVAFNPDGTLLAATRDKVTGFFNPANGQSVLMNPPFPGGHALAFSPDGKRIAISDGYTTAVRDIGPQGGEVSLDGPPNAKAKTGRLPAGVAWSNDGKWLALIRHDKKEGKWLVVIWGAGTGKGMQLLAGHAEPVTAIAWSQDGKVIASGSEDGVVILWDPETGKELWRKELKGRTTTGRVNALAISPADNTVAVAVSMGSGKGPERVVLLRSERRQGHRPPDARLVDPGFLRRVVARRQIPADRLRFRGHADRRKGAEDWRGRDLGTEAVTGRDQ